MRVIRERVKAKFRVRVRVRVKVRVRPHLGPSIPFVIAMAKENP